MKCWEESRGMELKNAQFSSHSSDLLLYVNSYWKVRPNWHRNDNWPFSVIKTVTRSAPIGEKLVGYTVKQNSFTNLSTIHLKVKCVISAPLNWIRLHAIGWAKVICRRSGCSNKQSKVLIASQGINLWVAYLQSTHIQIG